MMPLSEPPKLGTWPKLGLFHRLWNPNWFALHAPDATTAAPVVMAEVILLGLQPARFRLSALSAATPSPGVLIICAMESGTLESGPAPEAFDAGVRPLVITVAFSRNPS